MYYGRDLAGGDKLLLVDRFTNENYFNAAMHEGGIAGVSQDDNVQYKDNYDDDANTGEDPDNPSGISLEAVAARGKIAVVSPPEIPVELPVVSPPESPVELPGLASPENELYDGVVPPLLPSEYDINNDSD